MKIKKYIGALLLAAAALTGFSACQDDFDSPSINIPQATKTPNMTIADFKAAYWDDASNYIDTVGLNAAGEHIILGGRVVSSDASGNIYKNLVIQDATGALALSINANSLYNDYRIGQEIVIDVTDMYVGKYSTLQQLGFPDFSAGYGWQATFMPLEFFKQHSELNGLPEPSKVDTLTINISDLSNDAATLQKYQSQLVRFNNVHFAEGGEVSFCTAHKENTNRTLLDESGNEIIVRTSGYANFWSLKVPAENGDVVGILSTFLQSGQIKWQLALRSTSDLMNFGDPTLPKGTETNPYDVLDAVGAHNADQTIGGWFTGYIVGAPKAGVTEITSASDIQWTAEEEGGMFIVDNGLIIGQTPDARTLDDVMYVQLADASAFWQYGNLFDNLGNLGKQIWVKGNVGTGLGITAITDNTGSKDEFRIEGVTVPDQGGDDVIADGDGTQTSPYSAAQVNAKGNAYTQNGAWVKGYIVGWIDNTTQNYADANNTHFTVPATIATNILIASDPNEKDYQKCVAVNLPNTNNIRATINLVDNPGNLGKVVTVNGDIIKYFTLPGVKNVVSATLEGEGGGDTPTPPTGDAVTSIDESFASSALPTGWSLQTPSGDKSWFFSSYNSVNFAACTGYNGNGGSNGFDAWLITPAIDINNVANKTLSFKSMVGYKDSGSLEVYVLTTADPATATKTKLSANIPSPTGSWSDWLESGNISLANYNGTIYIGFYYHADATGSYTTYRVTDVKVGQGGSTGGGEEPNPPVSGTNSADLGTLDAKSFYGTYTTTNGWVAANCAVQQGGDADNNPTFKCLGGADVRAVCLNGKASTPGSLTSPTLSGGIKTLTFNYGFMFSEGNTTTKFTVNIKQGGAVVATKSIECEKPTKFDVMTFSMDCNISGNFVIEIVNDAYGNQSSNKERVSIWNIAWTN